VIDEIVDNYLKHARCDYVGLWQIAGRVRDGLALRDDVAVRATTLHIVEQLLACGVCAGTLEDGGFRP
jgi:hypothetical protein